MTITEKFDSIKYILNDFELKYSDFPWMTVYDLETKDGYFIGYITKTDNALRFTISDNYITYFDVYTYDFLDATYDTIKNVLSHVIEIITKVNNNEPLPEPEKEEYTDALKFQVNRCKYLDNVYPVLLEYMKAVQSRDINKTNKYHNKIIKIMEL